MTTSTRTLHPVQAGTPLAFAWGGLCALGIALDLLVVFAAPVVGATIALRPNDILRVVAAAYALLFAGLMLRRVLGKFIQMRVPGGMRTYGPDDAGNEPTRVPDVIASAVRCAVICVAAFVAADMAVSDKGVTAAVLGFLAGAMLSTGAAGATRSVLDFPRDWLFAVLPTALSHVIPSVALLAAALWVAPQGVALTALGAFWVAVTVMLIAEVVSSVMKSSRRALTEGGGELVDGVVARASAAPTLADHERARYWVRVSVVPVALLLAGVAFLAL